MTTPSPLRTLACPTCGAPLEVNFDQPTLRCKYCNAVIENPEYRPPQPVVERPAPIQIQIERPAYTPAKRKTGCIPAVSAIVLLALLLGVGGVVFAFIKNSGRIQLPQINAFPVQIESPALMLPSDGGAPNFISATFDVAKSTYALSRLDLGSHKVLWSALGQKDSLRVDALLAGDTSVYVVMESRLVALQLSDGKQSWEASLPDNLAGACERCISFQQGQVIVLTTDNSLGAYDALTGHQTWEKHFDNVGYTLYTVAGGVAVLYSTKNGAAMGIFDSSSGNEITHIEPTCQPPDGMSDELDVYSNVIVDNSGQAQKAYIFFGFFNACVQRWDLSSGKKDWENVEADQSLATASESPVLLANGELYYVEGHQLRSLDAASGKQMQVLEETKDYTLIPLFVEGQRLLVRATRTSGSTRYELWGYSLDNGKNLWKRPLLKSDPIDPPDRMVGLIDTDTTGWTYRLTPAGLWLITFQTQPNQVNFAQVNLDTGELTNPKSASLGLDSSTDFYDVPERVASSDQLAWYVMENRLYAIDAQAGAIPYRWP